MSSIRAAVNAARDGSLDGYKPVAAPTRPVVQQMLDNSKWRQNPQIRCPLPPFNSDPDTLRQFETGTYMPQIRVIPLPQPIFSQAVAATTTAVSSSSSSSSSSVSIKVQTASMNSGPLLPGAYVLGSIQLARSFQLLSLSTTGVCGVRLYGSALAQSFDQSRGTDAPVPPEITSNIITDIVLDTVPYVWPWQNKIGANQDFPQTSTAYITVVNTGTNATAGITVAVSYITLETA